MVNDWLGIVLSNNTPPLFLVSQTCLPRLVNELGWVILEFWAVLFYVFPTLVVFLVKRDGGIYSKVLVEKPTRTQPLPVSVVEGPVLVEQISVEYFNSLFPVLPKVASCKETRDQVSAQVVDPAFLLELSHGSVYSRISCLSLSPAFNQTWVVAPCYLFAILVSLHLVEAL